MSKRLIAGLLWFVAVGSLVESFTGVPRLLAPLIGVAAAAFVLLDPFGLFWERSASRTIESGARDVIGASLVR
jgi:hypothetical protein